MDNFIVKQSKIINGIFAFAFLAMAIGAYISLSDEQVLKYFSVIFLLVASILFFVKMYNKKIVIQINNRGIYYKNQKVCDWNDFAGYNMYEQEGSGSGGIDDVNLDHNTILEIYYNVPAESLIYSYKIKLPQTIDKSEEQIAEAINSFILSTP